jgi:FixJ family two-component response regulator
MILDDDETLLDALPATLQLRFPYLSVETFHSVSMASNRLKAQRFSMIMTDLVMPHSDGFEILGQAKACQPLTPVIAMTGRCDEPTARMAFDKGAFDLLWKPLDRDDLMQVVRCALTTYQLRDMVDRQAVRIRRLSHLIERAQHCPRSSDSRFGAISDRSRRIQVSSLQRMSRNVEMLSKYLTVREDKLGTMRQRLGSRLDQAQARAMGRLAEVARDQARFG